MSDCPTMVLLAELFGISICCVSAFIGRAIKDEEPVQLAPLAVRAYRRA